MIKMIYLQWLRACLHGGEEPQVGEVTCGDHPTYHVNVIKLKWEIIWTGRLPQLSRLRHLRGVPHHHVNRLLNDSHCVWVPGIKYQMTTDLKSILLLIHKQAKQNGKEFSSSLEVTGGLIQAPLQSVCWM